MTRTSNVDIAAAQRELDRAELSYETIRADYISGTRRDDELLAAARARVINAEGALTALARAY